MLEMDRGRIGFADALRPPEGYRVSLAIGTTYTLDLRALLGICIPLGLGFEPEALDAINPVSLFAALEKLQGRLHVFCNHGSIKPDVDPGAQSSRLVMMLEGMINQVLIEPCPRAKGGTATASFHPKVWVIEYEPVSGRAANAYRLLVMSRNVTFDTSWDVVASVDGKPGVGCACAGHVAGFLDFLTDVSPLDRRAKKDIKNLSERMRQVEFVVDNKAFNSVDFLPFGPHKYAKGGKVLDAVDCELFNQGLRNLLVVSPFLSEGGKNPKAPLNRFLEMAGDSSKRFVLISREDQLARIGEDVRDEFECYMPVSWLSDVELDGEDGADASAYSDLHAKLYFCEDRSSSRSLYIGSLNASRNGLVNNVEAMLRFDIAPYQATFDSLLSSLVGDESRSPFTVASRISAPLEEDRERKEFDEEFRNAVRSIRVVHGVVRAEGPRYRIEVDLSCKPFERKRIGALTVSPLLATLREHVDSSSSESKLVFDGLELEQVSAFFVLEACDVDGKWNDKCVLMCPAKEFEDEEAELTERSKVLLSSILKRNDGSLYLYIAHAFDLPSYSGGGESSAIRGVSEKRGRSGIASNLYEKLLEMAYSSPESIARATSLLDLIPGGVSDEELANLKKLTSAFQKAVR